MTVAWPKVVIVETQKPGEGLLGRWNQWLLLKDWKEQERKGRNKRSLIFLTELGDLHLRRRDYQGELAIKTDLFGPC